MGQVNYPTLTEAVQRGLPSSMGSAAAVVDLRPYRFGLTFPPRAVALIPNAKIRKPSFLNIDGSVDISVMLLLHNGDS